MSTFGDPNTRGRKWRDVILPGRSSRERRPGRSLVDFTGQRVTPKDMSGLSVRERAAAAQGDWDRWVSRTAPRPGASAQDRDWSSMMGRAKRAGVLGSHTEPGS